MTDDLILEPQRLTSPTVKVRRLGYLVHIPSIVRDREVSSRMFGAMVLGWANKNKKYFNHYSLQLPVTRTKRRLLTGEIRTLGAASRYIRTCEELGLVARIRGFRVSKIGKAISALSTDGNPFKLSLGQTFLVLRSLLEKDYDCVSVLIEILQKREEDKIGYFRNRIQNRLQLKIEKATEMNRLYLVDTLKRRIERLQKWQKPLRYYSENIEAPRIEWMLDLGLIKDWDQRTDAVDLQDKIDIFFGKDMISYKWLQDEFPAAFAKFYSRSFGSGVAYWTELDHKEKLNLFNRLLSESMKIFQTGLEIGKISADEFFEYSLGFLIQNESTVATLSDLEEDLATFARMGRLDYRYVRTVSPADRGYIARV